MEWIKSAWSLLWGYLTGPLRTQSAADAATKSILETVRQSNEVHEKNYAALGARCDAAEARSAQLQGRFDVVCDTLNTVKAEQAVTKGELADCKRQHKECEEKYGELERRLDAHKDAIVEIKKSVESNGTNGK